MPVTIELDGERATWDGERWTGDGPLARLGNRIAVARSAPSDPAGLENARILASSTGATILDVTGKGGRFPLVY